VVDAVSGSIEASASDSNPNGERSSLP